MLVSILMEFGPTTNRTITSTTTKFHASLDEPVQNEEAVLDKGFPKRVASTSRLQRKFDALSSTGTMEIFQMSDRGY